jgi:DNA-binding MarR family transcriptional regulator
VRLDYAALSEFRYRLRRFLAFSEDAAREAGLEPQQHQLLLAVRGFGDEVPTVRELSERLVLKHHSTVELVDRLEKRGLVRRKRSTIDRRVAHVQLTPRGTQVLERLTLAHRDELDTAGPALVTALQSVLRTLHERPNPTTPARAHVRPAG